MTDQYLNPITLEAKLFAQSLDNLASDYDVLDAVLVGALENVMKKIEAFIDRNANNVIVNTEKTQLTKLDGLQHLQRIFHCGYCKKDLGKAVTNAALHYADDCRGNHSFTTQKMVEMPAKKEERKEKKEKTPSQNQQQRLNATVNISKKTASLLRMDITALCKFLCESVAIGEKLKCLRDYTDIERDIMELLKPIYPQQSIKIYTFGSRMSGIGTRVSDLDIYIDVGERFRTFEHRPTKEFMAPLYKLHAAMKCHKKTWKGLIFIEGARVPILKTIHTTTGIECDINVTNSLGHINTQFLEYIFSLQPIAQLMCMYMKCWLTRTNLKADFSTYSTNLLVIFFLQQKQLLPPLSKFFESVDMDTALMVGPWKSSFVRFTLKDLGLQKADINNMLVYIKCFFHFYSHFDYKANVICPYNGEAVRKETLHSFMPSHYLNYIAADEPVMQIQLNKPMVIQDPIELNNNVTKGLSDFGLSVLREYMIVSLKLIEENNFIKM